MGWHVGLLHVASQQPAYRTLTPRTPSYRAIRRDHTTRLTTCGERLTTSFMNAWIDLKRKDGTIGALYDYWVLGRNAVTPEPRWSVLRNVLHWVK